MSIVPLLARVARLRVQQCNKIMTAHDVCSSPSACLKLQSDSSRSQPASSPAPAGRATTINPQTLAEMLPTNEPNSEADAASPAHIQGDSFSAQTLMQSWHALCSDSDNGARAIAPGGNAAMAQPIPSATVLLWALKHIWFGQDAEMTALAYSVRTAFHFCPTCNGTTCGFTTCGFTTCGFIA